MNSSADASKCSKEGLPVGLRSGQGLQGTLAQPCTKGQLGCRQHTQPKTSCVGVAAAAGRSLPNYYHQASLYQCHTSVPHHCLGCVRLERMLSGMTQTCPFPPPPAHLAGLQEAFGRKAQASVTMCALGAGGKGNGKEKWTCHVQLPLRQAHVCT